MAAAYRVVVSSVSCYSSVVVDRRAQSHAVHYCSGSCGALSQGLDCTVAHRSTCSELLTAPSHTFTHNLTRNANSPHQIPNSSKLSMTGCNGGSGVPNDPNSVYGVVGEDSPPWRGKKANTTTTTTSSGPDRPLQSSASLKDITGEAINLASGKLKEFSFEKLRLSTSHVTFRKGRKVRPDSYSRRSTDLDIIYGHFTGNVGGTGNGTITGNGNANDENLPPFSDTTKVLKGLSPASITAGGGSLSTTSLSSVSRAGGGSTSSLSSACSGSLEAGLNTVASLYLSSLADESLIARLLEKTRAGEEGGVGGAGGEDIRACLDILVKCSEDLKKCTDIIKQCISRKSPGGGEDGGASPESIYRAVMTRLSSYLRKLPLELEGAGLGLGSGAGGQGSGIAGHSELAELVSSLHMLQQAAVPFSPIFGNDQPPRYEDVVQNPPLPKSRDILPPSSLAPDSSLSLSTMPETAGRHKVQTNGLQHTHTLSHTHSPSPHTQTLSISTPPTQAHTPSSQTHTPSARTHTPSISPMEALFIEEDADLGRGLNRASRHTHSHTPTRSLTHTHSRNGTAFSPHTPPSSAHTHLSPNLSHVHVTHTLQSAGEDLTCPLTSEHTPPVTHRDDDIDKLLMDLECLSQSMGRERDRVREGEREREAEPPLPVKTRQRGTGQGNTSPQTQPSLQTQTQINPQAQRPVPVSHLTANAQATRSTPSSPAPLPQAEGSMVGLGDEEDGALLLRILESIESFAQELVDSGGSPGNTGKTGAQSKEKEVMRLLQDTLATAAKTDTLTQAKLPGSPPAGQDGPVHVSASTPTPATRLTDGPVPTALPVSTAPTPVPAPIPTTLAESVSTAPTPVPAPIPTTLAESVSTAPTPVPAPIPTTLAESVATDQATPSALPTPVPPPTVIPTPVPPPTVVPTPVPPPTVVPTPSEAAAGREHPPVADLTAVLTTTATPPPSPVPPPTPSPGEAPVATIAAPPVAVRHPVAPSDVVALRDIGSTLLIQQTPEVIRVQSNKQDKKSGTPPPAPLSPTPSVSPPHRSPSPPPTPVVLTPPPPPPPPPALNIPRFYYPRGLPGATKVNHDAAITAIETAFTEFEEEKADIYEMGKIAKACGCPLYWKAAMFNGAGGERTGFVSVHSFIATWRKLLHSCYDDSSKFIYLLAKPGCSYLDQEDFIPLLQDIVDTHPGLTFLKDAPEFHSRYITTVIQRIFYVVNRSWTGRITMTELRRSNFLQTLALLEEEDDINQITDYFSYEHFYVIYCKFWELDTDHDLYIDPKDLARYNDHASSSRIIERLFSGAVTRGSSVQREGRMSYAEFSWFLISEEDKKNPTSIEYWFRCMDTDGDGVLSMFELEYFYEEQCSRMEGMGIEPLPFTDLLCQMLDLVKPESQGKITLSDLKRCRMAHIFFDTFFNLEKYLDHEQRDPFALQKDIDNECPEPSDWDKYASEEYEILVAEETANEQLQEGTFDDDYEEAELPVQGEMVGNKMDKLLISDLSA
ncbi:serine/threonine-protein phosphatase 2A regulatory subunit B'' subunit alpha isoform X2 [Oncorhynchus mykiss]|uniref:serine/threonine-protein phosphatase 2A regulatory subunit B'' subunit alpha isoform X2 n=1 Tax=Oncorhynchus mykiss TaxID=8022 RepID=UPI001877C8DC|nr:serine/threonine-protein phosphatase 2A regulatory subunit B'' subunit alpha isoform X2 [Oncorhynchus mykiss]